MENKYGAYYEIDLFRSREMFVIGVGLKGEITSTRYDGQTIQQYNGLDAEAFARQMVESDPPWDETVGDDTGLTTPPGPAPGTVTAQRRSQARQPSGQAGGQE
jgi:hypothetical protein